MPYFGQILSLLCGVAVKNGMCKRVTWSLTSNQLKILAITAMVFDHLVLGFVPYETWTWGWILRVPGRVAAPIMCYFIAEGYRYTSNRKKYFLRLVGFALLSHFPYDLYFGLGFLQATSVIWALAMGLAALTAVKSENLPGVLKLLALGACCLLAITADWNYIAVLWIVGFGWFHGSFKKQMFWFAGIGLLLYVVPIFGEAAEPGWEFQWFRLGIFLAIPLLAFYHGRRGSKAKIVTWFFYIFYPVHLLVLYVARLVVS